MKTLRALLLDTATITGGTTRRCGALTSLKIYFRPEHASIEEDPFGDTRSLQYVDMQIPQEPLTDLVATREPADDSYYDLGDVDAGGEVRGNRR